MPRAQIVAYGMYVPDERLTNDFFINSKHNPYRVYIGEDTDGKEVYAPDRVTLTEDKILASTGGIRERRRAAPGETLVDMLEKAFQASDFPAKELTGILIGTISDERQFPSVACELQERIGAKNVKYTADLKAACSGYTHVLDYATLRTEKEGGYCLAAGAEILTRMIDYTEINCDLFGDGAGLTIVGPTENREEGVLATEFGSDTSGIRLIYKDKKSTLRMPNGPKVFRFATEGMIDIAHKLTEKTGINEKEIKLYIPHQANGRILEAVQKKVDPEKKGRIFFNIADLGNMSAATVPCALVTAKKQGKIGKGDLVTLIDFAAGLVRGSALVRV